MFKIVKKSTWEKLNEDLICKDKEIEYVNNNLDVSSKKISSLILNNKSVEDHCLFLEGNIKSLKNNIRECERSEAELTDKLHMVKDEYKQLKTETSKTINEITASKVKVDQETEKIRNEYNVLKSHADLITEANKTLRVNAQNLDIVRGQMNDIREVLAKQGKKLPKEVYEVYAKYFNENKRQNGKVKF